MLTGGTLSLTWVILSSSDMTKDIHQPLCFQQFSMATLQKHYIKRGGKATPKPYHAILFQARPRKSKQHQLPQWLMWSTGGRGHPTTLTLLTLRPLSSFHPGEQCTHTWEPLDGHSKKWLREAQLFALRKFNLQSIWPCKASSRGVQEPRIPGIPVTNTGMLTATDPFGSWGELARGRSTWPLPPPLSLLCGDRQCVYTGLGVGRHGNSTALHTTGTEKLLLAQSISVQWSGNWGATVATAVPPLPFRQGQLVFYGTKWLEVTP